MKAFALTFTLFAFFSVLGIAFMSVFTPRLRVMQRFLISPTIGVAFLVLPVFLINRAGLPVKDFGAILCFGLLALALIALGIKRPITPWKRLSPYLGVAAIGLLLAARPMFDFGFDWISYANDDMANYSLGAQRFFENGFFALPDMESFFLGKDYSQAFWFMHVLNNTRSGSELLLATIWAVTGLNPHQIFMPVVFALHGALIGASAAMLIGRRMPRRAALVGAALVAISPMTTLGALYQLIAQVGGMAMLCVGVVLIYQSAIHKSFSKLLTLQATPILLSCSLFVFYPEVLPFLGAGWLVFMAWTVWSGTANTVWPTVLSGILVAVGLCLVLNVYVFDALQFLLSQAGAGVKQANAVEVLFPYFLLPSGLPVAWGIVPIANSLLEPIASISILVAVAIFVLLLTMIRIQLKGQPTAVASVFLVMLCVGILLFIRNNDFGLFKLTMFAQPFILGVCALGIVRFFHEKTQWWKYGLVSLFAIANLLVQATYVEKSTGEFLGSLSDLPHLSKSGAIRQYAEALYATPTQNATTKITTEHIVLSKLQALYVRGSEVLFPSRQFLVEFVEREVAKVIEVKRQDQVIQSFQREKEKRLRKVFLPTEQGDNGLVQITESSATQPGLDLSPGQLNVFNRYARQPDQAIAFEWQDRNQSLLHFISSDLGQHYYLGRAGHIAYYALENDPMFPGKEFSALGRHFVFEVQSKESHPRVVIELTSTLAKQFDSILPNVKFQNLPIGFLGRGSGRLFSQPLTPYQINGLRYLALDIGREAMPMNEVKRGLMLAYGRNVRLDRRLMTTFGRDISLLPMENYQALTHPAFVSEFPKDLANPALEYSGIYEDGWISERAFFVLSANTTTQKMVILGAIPLIGDDKTFSTELTVKLADKTVVRQRLGLGDFAVEVPLKGGVVGKQRIDLTFSRSQQLPGADGRITSAKINFIGFE